MSSIECCWAFSTTVGDSLMMNVRDGGLRLRLSTSWEDACSLELNCHLNEFGDGLYS